MKNIIRRVGGRLLRPYGWLKSQGQRVWRKTMEEDYPIDFVITWVDGSDLVWQRSKAKYSGKDVLEISNSPARYRDWGLMRYWFRAVEQYAPWVHKIYYVTCGQKPAWLNIDSEKLVFVTHDEFIPKEYLPTFSTSAIELNLWRIPGLSEHFVYFNDDMFLNRPVSPKDFFEGGLPKLCALAIPFNFHGESQKLWWHYRLLNDISTINDTFDIRQIIRRHPEKFFSYVYHRQTKYNRRIYEDAYLTGMHHTHSVQTYLKSTFNDMWERRYDVLNSTCLSRFRSEKQVTSFLPTLWQIFQGLFVPVATDYFGITVTLTGDALPRVSDALQSSCRIVCLNDNEMMDLVSIETIERLKIAIQGVMEEKYPNTSAFEINVFGEQE